MEKKRSQNFLKRRKLMVMLPVLTLPFICALFWLLDGGKANAQGETRKGLTGLNIELPDAKLGKGNADKMSFYKQADKDSMALLEQIRNDPYYVFSDTALHGGAYQPGLLPGTQGYSDPNEERINQRLATLTQQLNQNYTPGTQDYYPGSTSAGTDVRKLDAMMQAMNRPAEDPEMLQLNTMLDKLLDLQNPHRTDDRLRMQSLKNSKQVYLVNAVKAERTIESVENSDAFSRPAGFYEWNDQQSVDSLYENAAEAVVAETRTLTAGATIKLKLVDGIMIAGRQIPAGTFVNGYCALEDERLTVSITSVKHGKGLFTVALNVYDNDGIRGIYVPGAITRDVAKNAASEAVQGFDLYSMNNSLGVQAATAGVNAVKTLVGKKAKLVKLNVKAGYKVFLKNMNEQEQ